MSTTSEDLPDDSISTFTKHLHQEWKILVDPDVPPDQRMAQAERLRPLLSETDGYITFKGQTKGLLPALDWNTSFRKAYSLLMWIRPRLSGEILDADPETETDIHQTRVLYRFSSNSDDSRAVGVCVALSSWQTNPDKTTVETTLTAYSLPHLKPRSIHAASRATYSSFVRVKVTLKVGEWQLLGINHTFPYLKRPVWSVAVDGLVLGQGELAYPVCENKIEMEDNQVLHNIVVGGAELETLPDKTDDQKSASELNSKPPPTKLALELDMASLALYPDPISTSIQAVVAEAGPNLSLQKGGRILPTLPPIPNWSKGSSMEGPKVGIPLTVHSAALDLQRLSGKFIFGVSALSARVLGEVGSSQRLVCPLSLVAGSTESTPRVGLVRPAEPIRLAEEDLPVLYLIGNASVFHAISNYLLNIPDAIDFSSENLDETTKNLSVALQEQNALSLMVMPFFLSLCTPGKLFDMHKSLYTGSIRHLYALYSSDGAFAAQLILMLADYMRTGGARAHEEALQGGIIHILAACLRLSLLRCQKIKFFRDPPVSIDALQKRFENLSEEIYPQTRHEGTSPSYVPATVADACVSLLEACCGRTTDEMDQLSPAMQIRRTSDSALTAVFGLALDLDLWGSDAVAASRVIGFVAKRYGGTSFTSGYILRSQISVQYFLDCLKLRFDSSPASPAVEETALQFSLILQSMLLSSLSNRRSISQGEHDVSACVSALTDSALGSVGCHVVLTAIVGVLAWCEVLPPEMSLTVEHPGTDDERKMHLASRLGRNLLMAQFHDVIAPMILSRTIFSGERTMSMSKITNQNSNYSGHLAWQKHWQLVLLLFSWVASIAGSEGLISAKAAGSLLLASSVAGSLREALAGSNQDLMNGLFLPPPAIALMIGSTIRDEWSYTDLLSDRLQIMMPLVPGLVISLVSALTDQKETAGSIEALRALLRAVGGTFHRVYGGLIHSTGGARRHVKNSRDGFAESIKAAKTYVPHLIAVAMALEDRIVNSLTDADQAKNAIRVMRPQTSNDEIRRSDQESWVDLSTESVVSELALDSSEPDGSGKFNVKNVLRSCQNGALNTAAGLLTNAMSHGGAGASVPLWQTVLEVFKRSKSYVSDERSVDGEVEKSATSDVEENSAKSSLTPAVTLSHNVLCRLISIVLVKCLKRDYQWEVWSFELSSAVSALLILVEEKGLLRVKKESNDTECSNILVSDDQVILLCALLYVLEYGRDATGWCQLALPAMSATNETRTAAPLGNLSETSKLLLPVLLPCVRLLLDNVDKVSAEQMVAVPTTVSTEQEGADTSEAHSLLDRMLSELDYTLTAAIVGLAFSSARDIALDAMATMRSAMKKFDSTDAASGAEKCRSLLCKVAEELRQRYKAERRLRETALFDAYEDKKGASEQAGEESIAVERLLLGGDVTAIEADDEEIKFNSGSGVSEDFVLFHENKREPGSARLGFKHYEGLGAALEECMNSDEAVCESTRVVETLTPYLDSWDQIVKRDAEESELVELFDSDLQLGAGGNLEAKAGNSEPAPRVAIVQGSESAADAMSTFFEFAAAEKSRLRELSLRFLPSARYSRISYADRFCWARFTEFLLVDEADVWERGIPDGNRDIRSRIPTVPFAPQFRRHIPKYLDNAALTSVQANETESKEDTTTDAAKRLSFISPAELDAFTKTLLEAGNLEIVDITKKELEDDGPDLGLERSRRGSLDENDDDLFLESGETAGEPEMEKPAVDGSGKKDSVPDENRTQDETVTTEYATDAGDYSFSPDELGSKASHHSITSSAFATPPDNASSSLGLMHSAAAGMIEMHLDNCLHVKPEGSRQCAMLLTSTHLILEYEAETDGFYDGELLAVQEEVDRQQRIADDVGPGGNKDLGAEELYHQMLERRQREIAAMRPKSIRWNLSEVSHIYLRRYRLRDSSIEMFFIPSGGTAFGGPGVFSPSCSVFLDFGSGREGMRRRNEAAYAMMKRAPPQAIKQWPDRALQFLHDHISKLTVAWVEGRISNFDYLLHLNILSGRSFNDICQYPVFPWVLADYSSCEIPDLSDKRNFRDLSKPVGALNPDRLEEFLERFETFADPSIPPFMYGSHYSTSAGVVLHFLVRLHPFAGLHRQLQSGHFDVADRLFSSVPRTWGMCTGQSAAEVKELTPEWYCNPAFLRNLNNFKLGTSQEGDLLGDVELPPWAENSPEKFIEVMRAALESDVCSEMLPDWIDLIFGRKQQGPEAIKANNVFFYLTYYGSVDVASIEDDGLRQATELQIAHFGQCPMQLFRRPHVRRLPRYIYRPHFFQLISLYAQAPNKPTVDEDSGGTSLVTTRPAPGAMFGEPFYLPFFSAPLSHWIHLDAPPPGPHAALFAVRLAGVDSCLAVDAKGIFHTFRWAWRNDERDEGHDGKEQHDDFLPKDRGCFIAQRELPRFRSVPRLMHAPVGTEHPAVAISKTLFAGRSVLLVLSAGDSRGGLGMQLVDPGKGIIRGEVMVPAVHSGRITCISTDPIGTAAGQGGVGGELAVVGSADGNASLWRFMSSHYLPLRPRNRLSGHGGSSISAVGLCSAIHIAVTVSRDRCCIHSIGNGTLMRSFAPPHNALDFPNSLEVRTNFAATQALAISVQGYVVTVCETRVKHGVDSVRTVTTLNLFNLEGISLGSQPLESWRGLPHRMQCTPDGTIVFVCTGRGVTMHRLSAVKPLQFVDEWQIAELDDVLSGHVPGCYDLDLGPSLSRPVCAAAACSHGVLRLHALPGISAFAERHRKGSLSQTVGTAFAQPAKRFNRAFREGLGFGTKIADMGRDIGKEVTSDVKEKGVGGFLGSMLFRKKS
ncbi:hypothetical protein ACA910_005124 [Epithemia clementina (nom. ined.)]